VLGLLARDANATAAKAIDTCESGFSVLMMGRTKSKDPLEPESLGNRTKFVIKKQGAWSSTRIGRPPDNVKEQDPLSEVVLFRVLDPSQLPSSSVPLEEMTW
jgi:hypothetical protein